MATEGFEAVFVETHNWGKSAKFFQELGYELETSTGDGSGVFRNGEGPYVVVVEIPEDRSPGVQVALKVSDADLFR
ncbi:VOC family protein, partial [Streptomyces sp. NPDC094045]